jgi:hypothetical protein
MQYSASAFTWITNVGGLSSTSGASVTLMLDSESAAQGLPDYFLSNYDYGSDGMSPPITVYDVTLKFRITFTDSWYDDD